MGGPGGDGLRNASVRDALILVALVPVLYGCAQDLRRVTVPQLNAPTAALKCAVAVDSLITRDQALCIAKVSGLERGITKWQVREFSDYVDVFNTTAKHPVERGVGVRIRRLGGSVASISEWAAITVR